MSSRYFLVVEHHRVDRILTFELQFDLGPSIERLP